VNKDKIKIELKNVFRSSRSQNQKDFIKADFIKKLWLSCYNDDEYELVNNEDNEKLNFKRSNFEALRFIGKEIIKVIKNNAYEQLQLVKILWDNYGKEGRLIAVYILSQINIEKPDETLPFIKELTKKCSLSEECDNIAIKTMEPVVINNIKIYLDVLNVWSRDENKWIRRSAITLAGRIPMKKPDNTIDSLKIIRNCLCDKDMDVLKSVSLALRLSTRGNIKIVEDFIKSNIVGDNDSKIWVFTDFVINLNKQNLLSLNKLYTYYLDWYNYLDKNKQFLLITAIKILEQVN
jgi:3-methyladenine DNA glycosylase AlkD